MNEEFWEAVELRRCHSRRPGRTGLLNIALLFGTAVIALSLIVMPTLTERPAAQRLARLGDNFDMITTGSIKRGDNPASYLP